MTGGTGQLKHDSNYGTARTRRPGQENWAGTVEYSWDRTAEISQPSQVGLKIQVEQVRLDRQRGQESQYMIARK